MLTNVTALWRANCAGPFSFLERSALDAVVGEADLAGRRDGACTDQPAAADAGSRGRWHSRTRLLLRRWERRTISLVHERAHSSQAFCQMNRADCRRSSWPCTLTCSIPPSSARHGDQASMRLSSLYFCEASTAAEKVPPRSGAAPVFGQAACMSLLSSLNELSPRWAALF
jgi:hypothetical protein